MNTFVINSDFLNADFASRFNLFGLVWGGQSIVARVQAEKMKRRGYVAPSKPRDAWTDGDVAAWEAAAIKANDGSAAPFDFAEVQDTVSVAIAVNQAAKTFTVGTTTLSFDGTICDLVINPDRSVSARATAKIPGQLINRLPDGVCILGQLYYDRSADELFVVTFRRFLYQTVFNANLTFTDNASVRSIDINISSTVEALPLFSRLVTKRWALQTSAEYSTSIAQTRGLNNNQWVVLENATFISVPTKPKTVKFFLSRFFDKYDYQFKLSDFVVAQSVGCNVSESADGAMAVHVSGPGCLEIVPKVPSRIFLGEDVVCTSDLHLRLTVI